MKRLLTITAAVLILLSSAALFSAGRGLYQVVEVYICEQEIILAEMIAKSSLSRQELTTVSYCTCEGVDPSMKQLVKKTKCDPPKDLVYACTCIGKSHY
jgi:hypothetical protein